MWRGEIEQLVDTAIAESWPLERVRAWVAEAAPRYERPPLDQPMTDQLVDEICDWQDRVQLLAQALQRQHDEARDRVESEPEVALRICQVAELLCPLTGTHAPRNAASFQMRAGSILDKLGRSGEAAGQFMLAAGNWAASGETVSELVALALVGASLLDDRQFEKSLELATSLAARARAGSLRGIEAAALRLESECRARLGRPDPITPAREALRLRRTLPDKDALEQNAGRLEPYLDAFGRHSRSAGHYQDAYSAFTELLDLSRRAGGVSPGSPSGPGSGAQAWWLSELALTCTSAGEYSRAERYFEDAIRMARAVGDEANARRWELQLAALRRQPTTAAVELVPPQSEQAARELSAAAANLLAAERNEDAAAAATLALEWAQRNRDAELEIAARNSLGVATHRLGRLAESLKIFYRAIRLADHRGLSAGALGLRFNLANALVDAGKYQDAVNVILTGIAHTYSLLESAASAEERKQIAAGSLDLYEQLASLCAQTGNAAFAVPMLERARALTLGHWIELGRAAAVAGAETSELLRDLRLAEVEVEVRHVTGRMAPSAMAGLGERIQRSRAGLEVELKRVGLDLPRIRTDVNPRAETTATLREILRDGVVAVTLFTAPHGVAILCASQGPEEPIIEGKWHSWERDEVASAVAAWRRRQGADELAALSSQVAPLITGIEELARARGASRLVIVPQGITTLLPFWSLADRLAPDGLPFSVAPSLRVFQLCNAPPHPAADSAVVIGDATGTLPGAEREAAIVRRALAVPDARVLDTAEEVMAAAAGCGVLHISAHGIFNPENPHWSGFVVAAPSAQSGILGCTYHPQSGRFTDRPTAGAWPLLTAAECSARLTLRRCRLAVLAACESGMASIHGAGEMTGLATGLLAAGARSVIGSLWPVDDQATTVLMSHLYRELASAADDSPAAALQRARRALATTDRAAARELIGTDSGLDEGDLPFAAPCYTDAFQCFGAL